MESLQENDVLLLLDTVIARTAATLQKEREFNLIPLFVSESSEVHLHSRLLAELLDPHGSHKKGDAFLRAWLAQLGITGFDPAHCTVACESDHIDILVTNDRRQAVLIENKIYAGDQERQLPRYVEALNRRGYRSADQHVVYLTLEGGPPDSLDELAAMQVVPQCVSYAAEVDAWLLQCIGIAADAPRLRESLFMYREIVLRLTHKDGDPAMQKAIYQEITRRPTTLQAAFAIEQQARNARIGLQFAFWNDLQEELKTVFARLGLVWTGQPVTREWIENYYAFGGRGRFHYGIESDVLALDAATRISFRVEIEDRLYFGLVPTPVEASAGQRGSGAFDAGRPVFEAVNGWVASAGPGMKRNPHWFGWCYAEPDMNWLEFDVGPGSLFLDLLNDDARRALCARTAKPMADFLARFMAQQPANPLPALA